jgi:ABC-type microcin C transport system permease subunit YejB
MIINMAPKGPILQAFADKSKQKTENRSQEPGVRSQEKMARPAAVAGPLKTNHRGHREDTENTEKRKQKYF